MFNAIMETIKRLKFRITKRTLYQTVREELSIEMPSKQRQEDKKALSIHRVRKREPKLRETACEKTKNQERPCIFEKGESMVNSIH